MSDINNLTITGVLVRDAQKRFTGNDKPVISFTLANQTGYGDYEKTNWFNCSLFGNRANSDALANALIKGLKMTVSGQVTLNEYQKEGVNKANLSVMVNDLAFGGNSGGGKSKQNQQQQSQPAPQDDFSDDIPF